MTAQLEIRAGIASETGQRPDNQDFAAMHPPEAGAAAPLRNAAGVIAAIADGVGGAKGGRVAAELCVRMFIDAVLAQNAARGVRHAAMRGLEAANRWIHSVGARDPALEGMACTFTALVLRGRQAHVLHVGDSRLYRLRDDRLTLLTTDHAGRGGQRHMLTRAIGLADVVRIDCTTEEARVHDRFLLCTDGVHGVLSESALHDALRRPGAPAEAAADLVRQALDRRGGDNATALVLDVLDLPPANLPDIELTVASLPILLAPKTGAAVDGYRLDVMLADGRYSRVFRATDTAAGAQQRAVIMKFPKPAPGTDALLRQAFLRESWIAARVRSPWVGEVIEPPPDRRSRLYVVMPFYAGDTLEQRLQRKPALRLAAGLDIALKLARGVAALHRAGIIHRDIKPDNVILEHGGGVRLIDLGVARLPFLDDSAEADAPGTPGYKAPELFTGQTGDARSDLFALGVTLYRMFAGSFPYPEAEPFSRPRFGQPTSLGMHRPDLPAWLDQAITRACAPRPEDRFEDVLELVFNLEHGAVRAVHSTPRRQPLYARNPVLFWQIVAAILAILLAVAGVRWH